MKLIFMNGSLRGYVKQRGNNLFQLEKVLQMNQYCPAN